MPFFLLTNGLFRSAKTQKSFCKQSFKFVEPFRLDDGEDGKKLNITYVTIDESLKDLDEYNKDHISLYKKNNADDSVLSDICDRAVFKANPLFLIVETYFGIILYQDSFEVANIPGSAKTKHKILAVYYTLTNIQPEKRSGTEQMQLVLLCKESVFKKCSYERVFSRLIRDFKKLESEGLQLNNDVRPA